MEFTSRKTEIGWAVSPFFLTPKGFSFKSMCTLFQPKFIQREKSMSVPSFHICPSAYSILPCLFVYSILSCLFYLSTTECLQLNPVEAHGESAWGVHPCALPFPLLAIHKLVIVPKQRINRGDLLRIFPPSGRGEERKSAFFLVLNFPTCPSAEEPACPPTPKKGKKIFFYFIFLQPIKSSLAPVDYLCGLHLILL